MAHPNEELLRSFYGAFARRDIDAVRGLLTDDAVFHQPGRNPTSGDYQGVNGVLELVGKLQQLTGGTFRAEAHDLLGSDDHGVALLHVTAERDGRHLDVTVVHVIHVRGGKVAEVWVHPRDTYAVDEFWR
jgi:ketosteroid isomerase-like protein